MKPDFSEFSYGYAFTEELVSSLKAALIAAPVFPSLRDEGKPGGGYDVKIPLRGRPVFLQFKLSDFLSRENAKEHRDGHLRVPYYRMHLRPIRHSDQHPLLLDLERSGEAVFYVSPEFHLPAELNSFYLQQAVIPNSAAFAPTDIGDLPDRDSHYVAFERGSPVGVLCSDDPREVKKTQLRAGFRQFLRARDISSRDTSEGGLLSMAQSMLEVLKRTESRLTQARKPVDILGLERIIQERRPIEALGYISQTVFDCELVLVAD